MDRKLKLNLNTKLFHMSIVRKHTFFMLLNFGLRSLSLSQQCISIISKGQIKVKNPKINIDIKNDYFIHMFLRWNYFICSDYKTLPFYFYFLFLFFQKTNMRTKSTKVLFTLPSFGFKSDQTLPPKLFETLSPMSIITQMSKSNHNYQKSKHNY